MDFNATGDSAFSWAELYVLVTGCGQVKGICAMLLFCLALAWQANAQDSDYLAVYEDAVRRFNEGDTGAALVQAMVPGRLASES